MTAAALDPSVVAPQHQGKHNSDEQAGMSAVAPVVDWARAELDWLAGRLGRAMVQP